MVHRAMPLKEDHIRDRTDELCLQTMLMGMKSPAGGWNRRTHRCPPDNDQSLSTNWVPAAAAAKSLQLCLTLCDPIDGSPPGSPVPGILQARTLEWVAISFSNA